MPIQTGTGPVPATPPKRFEIPQIDTIRVLAMLAIFLHHLWKTVIVKPETAAQSLLDPIFTSASDGVILFNIISGFLLALPHLGPERRPFAGYRFFLTKRFFRIIPPYYLALLFFTAANMVCFAYPLVPALQLMLKNLLFVNSLDYSNMMTNFSHFWYLGQLAQFYLLFPPILSFFLRIGPGRAAFSITALCWSSWVFLAWFFPAEPGSYPNVTENLMHFNLPGRLPEFALGMWLASIWNPSADSARKSISNRPFLLFAACLALYIPVAAPFLKVATLPFVHVFHVAIGLVIFLALFAWSAAARIGKSALAKDFSEHSYSLYIVHHPFFSYFGVTPATVSHTLGNFALLTALLLPVSYVGARVLDWMSAKIIRRVSDRGKH